MKRKLQREKLTGNLQATHNTKKSRFIEYEEDADNHDLSSHKVYFKHIEDAAVPYWTISSYINLIDGLGKFIEFSPAQGNGPHDRTGRHSHLKFIRIRGHIQYDPFSGVFQLPSLTTVRLWFTRANFKVTPSNQWMTKTELFEDVGGSTGLGPYLQKNYVYNEKYDTLWTEAWTFRPTGFFRHTIQEIDYITYLGERHLFDVIIPVEDRVAWDSTGVPNKSYCIGGLRDGTDSVSCTAAVYFYFSDENKNDV